MTSSDVREQAKTLRSAGRFADAAVIFRRLWDSPGGELWDGWGLAWCLRKLERYDDALEVCREVWRRDKDFAPTKQVAAWCLYLRDVQPADQPGGALTRAVDAVAGLHRGDDPDPYNSFSAYPQVLLHAARVCLDHNEHEAALEHTDRLDAARLSTERGMVEIDGRPRTLPSHRERYYSIRSKALAGLERWQECLDCCSEGLASVSRFAADGEAWLRYRAALAILRLGDAAAAATELRKVLARHDMWFIHLLLAEALAAAGQHDAALGHAGRALQGCAAPPQLTGSLPVVARLLADHGDNDAARDHAKAAAALRGEQGWRVPTDLVELLNKLAGSANPQRPSEELLAPLRIQWASWAEATRERRQGRIARLLATGHAGFVEDGDGQQMYFRRRDFQGPAAACSEGTPVSFEVVDGFDHKKNRPAQRAVNVAPV